MLLTLAELGASFSVLALARASFAAAPKQPVKATVRARVHRATAHAPVKDKLAEPGSPPRLSAAAGCTEDVQLDPL